MSVISKHCSQCFRHAISQLHRRISTFMIFILQMGTPIPGCLSKLPKVTHIWEVEELGFQAALWLHSPHCHYNSPLVPWNAVHLVCVLMGFLNYLLFPLSVLLLSQNTGTVRDLQIRIASPPFPSSPFLPFSSAFFFNYLNIDSSPYQSHMVVL